MKIGDRYQFRDIARVIAGFVESQTIIRRYENGESVYEMKPTTVVEALVKSKLWEKLPG